jgi:hypothetical protein
MPSSASSTPPGADRAPLDPLARRERDGPYLLVLTAVVLVVCWLGDLLFRNTPALVDESNHYRRVLRAREGNFEPDSRQTNPGAYYILMAGLSWVWDATSLQGLRRISLCLGLLALPLVYLIRRRLSPPGAVLVTAQFFFLPLLLPFEFLVYIEPAAVVALLLALLFALDDRPALAGCAAIAGVLMRQPQVIWALFVLFLPYVDEHGWKLEPRAVARHLARGWVFLVGFAAFALFVVVNRGVALGDRPHHPIGLYTENVFLGLFLCAAVFLPLHVANLGRIVSVLHRQPEWIVVLAGLFCVYWFTFHADHPYNNLRPPDPFLRNWLLVWLEASALHRVLFFVPVAWAFLSLVVTRLQKPAFALLYPCAVLFLAPSWLVEPRYAIPFLVLFLVLREGQPLVTEIASLGWCVLLSGLLLVGTAREWFFL